MNLKKLIVANVNVKFEAMNIKDEIEDILYATDLNPSVIERVTEKLLNLHSVSQRYTIEDIERCVENWGLCKVEKEYIEKFLNGG